MIEARSDRIGVSARGSSGSSFGFWFSRIGMSWAKMVWTKNRMRAMPLSSSTRLRNMWALTCSSVKDCTKSPIRSMRSGAAGHDL